jgi:type VI secretion system protein VasG
MIGKIARLQLGRIAKRVQQNHKIPFTYDDDVVKLIVSRCTELESGGRMIDSILTNTLLPRISQELLTRMMEGKPVTKVATTVKDGDFDYAFDESTEPAAPAPDAQPPAPPATGEQAS